MKTRLQVLTEARELISAPERWTQMYLARDANGYSVTEDSSDAICWCAGGAVLRVAESWNESGALNVLKAACGAWVSDFNDTHTHAEVLAAFDRAIASEREKEKA